MIFFFFIMFNLLDKMKYFSSAGILPFFLKNKADKVVKKLNYINKDIDSTNHDYLKEQFSIFSVDFSKDSKKWEDYISDEDKEMLEKYYDKNIKDEHQFLREKEVTPNYMVEYLYQKINDFDKKKNYSKFNGIIGIEAITSKVYEDTKGFYHESNFSVFAGSRNPGEKNINDVAKRECREEGKITFSDKIFGKEYQDKVRKKYKINIPICINIPIHKSRSMKIFIIFIDNFSENIIEDENGKYLHITPYESNQGCDSASKVDNLLLGS